MCDSNTPGTDTSGEPLFIRSAALIGAEGIERLRALRVAVFGIGGVGGYAVEALARAGVGTLHLIDGDTIAPSNLNRQLFALHSTIGQNKTAAAAHCRHKPGLYRTSNDPAYTSRTRRRAA